MMDEREKSQGLNALSDLYDAVQDALHRGRMDQDIIRARDRFDGDALVQVGPHVETLVTLLWPEDRRMLRWRVPVHGGGTRLVAYTPAH